MDWNSKEGRDLLWKAYPDGYLAKRGVMTVGGWTYIGFDGRHSWVREPSEQYINSECDLTKIYEGRGDLLPLPDPSDTATWACLLEDLAEAVNARCVIEKRNFALHYKYGGLSFSTMTKPYWALRDVYSGAWQWACQTASVETVTSAYGSYPAWRSDHAEALITLRAYERSLEVK